MTLKTAASVSLLLLSLFLPCAASTVHQLCTVHCALCTVYCPLCTVHCPLCTVYCLVGPDGAVCLMVLVVSHQNTGPWNSRTDRRGASHSQTGRLAD